MGSASGFHDLLWIASVSTCIKLLMIPSYHSTDFEVHRHWLAITHSLPLREWYMDETSEWTLDYPPFFAWFERFLALFASRIDPKITDLKGGLNYDSNSVVVFQRTTVMLADLVLYYGLWKFCRNMADEKQRIIYASVILSPGLFIVDHMHFQYNGPLLGMLLISLACLRDGQDLVGGIWFAVLVCFKHLFAVAGPIYFVYLLRHYCRGPSKILNFFKLGSAVICVVVVAFAPFVYLKQMDQVLKRLFPFGRGLCHSYWAPNAWALYNATDKVLAVILRKLGKSVRSARAGLTGGLVGDFSAYAVLPQITPAMTAGLVLVSLLPCLYRVWQNPKPSKIVRWVAYAYTCGFMFGWHVHEKASLHFVIPLALVALESREASADFLFLSTVSYYSLFPLLFGMAEYPVKVLLLLLYAFGLHVHLLAYWKTRTGSATEGKVKMPQSDKKAEMEPLLEGEGEGEGEGKGEGEGTGEGEGEGEGDSGGDDEGEGKGEEEQKDFQLAETLGSAKVAFLWGIIFIEIYGQVLHRLLFKDSLPFIPLLLISVYCAAAEFYMWAKQLMRFVLVRTR